MIETRPNTSVESTNVTPKKITVTMILEDLASGITKKGMCTKYNVKKWEMDEVFKHPKLKGKRPAYVKVLSFKFVDDTGDIDVVVPANTVQQPDKVEDETEEETVDPAQVTIDQVIEEETTTQDNIDENSNEEEDMTPPTMEDTMELVEEQLEEVEEDDFDTFEL